MRGGEGAGQSQGLLFWRKGKLLGGRIPKHLAGFVTPDKKHMVHAHFSFLYRLPPLSRESICFLPGDV